VLPRRAAEIGQLGVDGLIARGFAESVRYIGVVTIATTGDTAGQTVLPLTGHYYHAQKFSDECLGAPLILGKWQTKAGEPRELRMHPFTRIPKSAALARMPEHLAELTTDRFLGEQGLVRWIESDPSPATDLAVTGWTVPGGSVADIVLIGEETAGERYAIHQDEQQQRRGAVAPHNSVVTILQPPTPEQWAGQYQAAWNSTVTST
jgi:hypothetical protein